MPFRFANPLLALVAAAVLTGCQGPRLKLENAEVTSFDIVAKTVSWSTNIRNSTAGQNYLFCRRTKARGELRVQAWLTQSTDLADFPKLPAGGILAVAEGDALDPGDTTSVGLTGVGLQANNLSEFQYLIIEAYTEKAATLKESANDSCRRYYAWVVLPLD